MIEEIPGLAIACIGLADQAEWLFMALGEPHFSPGEEMYAQQFMRRHGLDQRRFSDLHEAAASAFSALGLEPGLSAS